MPNIMGRVAASQRGDGSNSLAQTFLTSSTWNCGFMSSKKVDWYYRRSGCNTCKKMDAFLEQHGVVAKETVSANKEKLGPEVALELAEQVSKIVAARGKSVVEFRPQDADADFLRKHLVGPTGNLRSPVIRKGKTLFVGFNEDAFTGKLA